MKSVQGTLVHLSCFCKVFHPLLFGIFLKLLRCVCFNCNKLCLTNEEKEHIKGSRKTNRIKSAHSACNSRSKCPHCGAKLKRFLKDGVCKIVTELDDGRKQCVVANEIHVMLQNVPSEELNVLMPENFECFFMGYLLIPPPVIRPSVVLNTNNIRGEDDITHKLIDIVKFNKAMEEEARAPTKEDMVQLNVLIYSYLDTDVQNNSNKTRSSRPMDSVKKRLKGKEGRVRGNLMGKRVDFSARSVITPDSSIAINELGVPVKMKRILTVPEKVNVYKHPPHETDRGGRTVWLGAVFQRQHDIHAAFLDPDAVGQAQSVHCTRGLRTPVFL